MFLWQCVAKYLRSDLDRITDIEQFPEEEKEILDSYLECYYMKLDAVLPGGILAAGIFELEEDELN